MGRQPGFFDVEDRLKRLSDLGDQLEAFSAAVDFEMFRPTLDASLAYSDGAKGGRPPLDPVLMFKVLVIQAANNLSDERTEYLVNDRLSFMRFLGLGLGDRVPDARTIWLFRERLTQAVLDGKPAIEVLFARFDAALRAVGYIAMSGQIVTPRWSRLRVSATRPRRRPKSRPDGSRPSGRPGLPSSATRTGTRAGRSSSPRPSRRRTARSRRSTSPSRSSATRTTSASTGPSV